MVVEIVIRLLVARLCYDFAPLVGTATVLLSFFQLSFSSNIGIITDDSLRFSRLEFRQGSGRIVSLTRRHFLQEYLLISWFAMQIVDIGTT